MNTPKIFDLIRRARSFRRFKEKEAVPMAVLESLVDMARLSPSAGNHQPLRYVLVTDPAKRAEMFPCLGWAAYLKDWKGPAEGERPAAYVVVLCHEESGGVPQVDAGLAMQSMRLGAQELGLGGCMLGSVNRDKLALLLGLAPGLSILYVLALGKPAEEVVLEELAPGGDIKYWRDEKDAHHVPKRTRDEMVVGRFGT